MDNFVNASYQYIIINENMTILGFRDPHAFTKEKILMMGLEDQEDQPFLDAVDTLTRDQASYLRLLMLNATHVDGIISITKDRLTDLLSTARNFQLSDSKGVMQ